MSALVERIIAARDRLRGFADHLGCTNVECAKALGLSGMSVGRHVATLRKEWE